MSITLTAARDTDTEPKLLELDRATLLHPHLPATTIDRIVMVRGDGCRLFDSRGREYLDATGGLWLAQVGHGRRELADVAAKQMAALEYFTTFWEFSNQPSIDLAARLVELAPDSISRVYYTSGGSESNDAAIRMARLFHQRRGEPNRTWILSRNFAYHGIAYGGGSATGLDGMKDGMGPNLPHVHHLTPPWPYQRDLYQGEDPTDFCVHELRAAIESIGAENIAAFLGEPIMGVAGMVDPPADYWSRICEVLDEYDILLILDEVVTAFGRTGEWFAADRYGIEPDIIVTAKGITSGYIPLGAVLMSAEIAEVLESGPGFPVGYTYCGHPTACAVALANLAIIENEGLVARANEIGSYLGQALKPLERHDVVGQVRQVGMMLGIELVQDGEKREPVLPLCSPPLVDVIRSETGVIVRGGRAALVMSPPLILSEAEADHIADSLDSVISRLSPDGSLR